MIVSNSFPLGVLLFLYWLVKQIALPKTSAIGWATFAYCLYCCAKAKDRNFYLGRKLAIYIFWEIQDILYHVHKYLESISLFVREK